MRSFRNIIEDIKAPSVQDLWLNNGKLKYYGEKGWQDINGQDAPTVKWDDIEDRPETFAPSKHTHTKSNITDFPTLATVATSGSYNDLSNKPDIPSAYSLPNASTSARGGVLMATAVADLIVDSANAEIIAGKVNDLLAALRAAGILQS